MCMAPMEEYPGIIIKGPNLSTEKDTIKIITGLIILGENHRPKGD